VTAVALSWSTRWETELTADEHRELGAVLTRIFPDDHVLGAEGRSWVGAIPELRIVGRDGERVVAHLAVARRFVRVRGAELGEAVLVGDVGLVGVDPDYRGQHLGLRLLEQTDAVLARLGVAFGMLVTGEERVRFYSAGGWVRAENPLLNAVDLEGRTEPWTGPLLIRPITASVADWPAGELERNAQEI
jgi:nodulation protein A